MPLQSSGAIALDDMHQEAGGSANSNCTINDADIRDMIDKSSGATMAFNEWYGASSDPDIGMFANGYYGSTYHNVIDYVTISSTGNASDWGDSTASLYFTGGHGNRTYGITRYGGRSSATGWVTANIDYVTWASQGDAADWGDAEISYGGYHVTGCGNSTRGIWSNGAYPAGNTISYLSLSSTGNGADFGNTTNTKDSTGNCSSTTRAVISGGHNGGAAKNRADYITIASTGNATDFGQLNGSYMGQGAAASATRGLFFGGTGNTANGTRKNSIMYITIATTGTSDDFGDMTLSSQFCDSTANATRAITGHGYINIANVIDYVTIGSTGNSTDFGDLSVQRGGGSALGSSAANAA